MHNNIHTGSCHCKRSRLIVIYFEIGIGIYELFHLLFSTIHGSINKLETIFIKNTTKKLKKRDLFQHHFHAHLKYVKNGTYYITQFHISVRNLIQRSLLCSHTGSNVLQWNGRCAECMHTHTHVCTYIYERTITRIWDITWTPWHVVRADALCGIVCMLHEVCVAWCMHHMEYLSNSLLHEMHVACIEWYIHASHCTCEFLLHVTWDACCVYRVVRASHCAWKYFVACHTC